MLKLIDVVTTNTLVEVEEAWIDGGCFDHQLEGVMFKIISESNKLTPIGVYQRDKVYFETLNQENAFDLCKKYLEQIDPDLQNVPAGHCRKVYAVSDDPSSNHYIFDLNHFDNNDFQLIFGI